MSKYKTYRVRVTRQGVQESHFFDSKTWGNLSDTAAKSFIAHLMSSDNLKLDGFKIEVAD